MIDDEFPSVLCGTHATVRAAWRKRIRKAIATRSWDEVTGSGELVSLSDFGGGLVLEGPCKLLTGKHILLYELMTELDDLTSMGYERKEESFQLRRGLILHGIQEFWFCLGLLGANSTWISYMNVTPKEECQSIAAVVLDALLNHWTRFIELDGRFLDAVGEPARWPYWGMRAFFLCADLGIEESELRPFRMNTLSTIGPHDAAAQMREWLNRVKNAALRK